MAPLCNNENEENDAVFCIGDDLNAKIVQVEIEEYEEIASASTSTSTNIVTTTSSSSPSSSSSSSSLSSSSNKLSVKRSVSFSAEAAVHVGAIINVDDYTNEEKYECWYNVDEMRRIRQEVKHTIALMNQMIPRDQIESDSLFSSMQLLCTRGLEGKTRTEKRHRRDIRMKSISAVFDEQSMQDMDGIFDPVMVAMAYDEYSYPMKIAAFQRAAQYEKEATGTENNDNDNVQASSSSSSTFSIIGSEGKESVQVAGPTEYDFRPCRSRQSITKTLNILEIEQNQEEEDAVESDFSSSSSSTTTGTSTNEQLASICSEIIILDLNKNKNNRLYSSNTTRHIGGVPMRFRDRFTCLLPLRVVHI